jgi:hypothetical protein
MGTSGKLPQRARFGHAAMIFRNDAASSEAPPTSAPSTSSTASSSAAFSALTEPP